MGIRSIFWKVVAGKNPENGWSDSIQVEHFEPFTPGQLTKNFTATVADELTMTRGTTVKALYRDDQWIYVQASDGRRGFVPQTHCKLLVTGNNQKTTKRPNKMTKPSSNASNATLERRWEKSNLQRFIDSLPVQKEEGEPYDTTDKCDATVTQSFKPNAVDDLEVHENEIITILNCTDSDWFYARNSQNDVGFVPSSFIQLPAGFELPKAPMIAEKWENENLLVVEPFTGRSGLDLTVRPGEWIKCSSKPVDDWIWAQRMSDDKQGFIPSRIVILATDL